MKLPIAISLQYILISNFSRRWAGEEARFNTHRACAERTQSSDERPRRGNRTRCFTAYPPHIIPDETAERNETTPSLQTTQRGGVSKTNFWRRNLIDQIISTLQI